MCDGKRLPRKATEKEVIATGEVTEIDRLSRYFSKRLAYANQKKEGEKWNKRKKQ